MKKLLGRLLSRKWTALKTDRPSVEEGEYPGVYLLSFTEKDLEGAAIDLSDVFYVGMSNSLGGVNQRLKQFVSSIEGGSSHVPGERFFKEPRWGNRTRFSRSTSTKRFYVAAITIPCEVAKPKRGPEDLRRMGDVAGLEYYVLAHVKEVLTREPELNKK